MENFDIYKDITERTGGDVYIGVVGPVRTGKSTFIKRFMETLVIPNIENVYAKERAHDELPQSGSGRTIMTAEPKFVPEEAAQITMEGGASFSVRLIDCVGYMVPGAVGQFEGEQERMVTTPWFDHEISMTEAAETGTRKVIAEHSTIGIVVTTDGSITEISREDYIEAENRVINELKAIGKPFLILINSAEPTGQRAQSLRAELIEKHGVTCIITNCMTMTNADIENIIKAVLYEFPVYEFGIFLPPWVDALPMEHTIKSALLDTIRKCVIGMSRIKDVDAAVKGIGSSENISLAAVLEMNLGRGSVMTSLEVPRELFYSTLSEQSGFDIHDDGDLISLLTDLSTVKREYDRIDSALRDVRENGYGIVMPSREELRLEEPEIVRQGGRYGVKLKASAPSIHIVCSKQKLQIRKRRRDARTGIYADLQYRIISDSVICTVSTCLFGLYRLS